MGEKRFRNRVGSALGVRPGEETTALLFFAYFFLITAPFTIVKSVRDASYLDDIGVRHLPWAYATAALVGVAVAVHARLQSKLPRRHLLVGSLAFFGATALLFRALFSLDWPVVTIVYWLWANVFIVVLTTQFWFLVNDVFNPREAKRLVGVLGGGGILGGIAGGLLTGFLAQPGRPEGLLYAAAAFLAAGAAVVAMLFHRLDRAPNGGAAAAASYEARAGFVDSLRTVRRDSYLRTLAALALITGIVSTFADWQSKAVIDGVPAAKANLAAFFGRFNAGLLALTFLVQIGLTGRLLGRFGLRFGLMVYPLALLMGTAGAAAWPVLGWAVAVKSADKAFSYSIQQSSRELLYIPVSPERKYRAKVFIDMFVNRFSKTAGAGVLLLLFLLPGGQNVRVVGVAAAALIAVWIAVNVRLGRAYGRAVKDRLEEKWRPGQGLVSAATDAETAKTIIDALESRRRSPSLYALHLLDLSGKGRLTPEILRLLEEESAALAPAASHPLLDGDEQPWLPGRASDLLAAETDIREILALPDYQRVMDEYAARVLRGEAGDETARMELAKAAGLADRRAPLADRLDDLLLDDSADVVHYAAESAGRLRRRESVPLLVLLLSNPRCRADAEAALLRYGPAIAGTLGDSLLDPDEPQDRRGRIAAVLAGNPSQDAADALLAALAGGRPDIDRDLIEALDRIRGAGGPIVFDENAVRAGIGRELARLAASSVRTDGLGLFKLLGLMLPHDDLTRAGQNFTRGTENEVAFALELVDHLLPLDLKEKILPVLDRLSAGAAR